MPTATRKGEAAYQRVARALREEILKSAGDQRRLPTEAELAVSHQVSRQTVRRAFQDLVAEGMVERVPGRGTFAAQRDGRYLRQFGSIDDLMALSVDTDLAVVKPLSRKIDVTAARRLQLESDVVGTVVFLRLHADVPFCVTSVYLPPELTERLVGHQEFYQVGARSKATLIGILDAILARPIADAEQSITAVSASNEEAELLHAAIGQPLLGIDRTYFDTTGTPVEWAVSRFLPEQYSYRVRLRRNVR